MGSGRFWTPLLRFEFDPDDRADVAVPAVVVVAAVVAAVGLCVEAVILVVRIPPSAMPTFPAGHETPLANPPPPPPPPPASGNFTT